MAKEISELTSKATPVGTDEIEIQETGGGSSKKATLTAVLGAGLSGTFSDITSGGNVVSDTDSTDDLGTTGVRWANLYVDDITATTSITAGGAITDGAASSFTSGSTIGNLTLANGSITDSSGAISFGNESLTTTGVITGLTVEATGDTSAGDNAAMGYTATEGLVLTGQGSTNDVTIKNDADAAVISIPTGTTGVTFAGALTASNGGSLTGTWSDLGTVTTVDINGGTLDGVVIGGASAAAADFTTVNTTGAVGVGGDLTVTKAGTPKVRIEDSSNDGYDIRRDNASGFLHLVGSQTTFSGYRFYVNDTDLALTVANSGAVTFEDALIGSGPIQQGGTSRQGYVGANFERNLTSDGASSVATLLAVFGTLTGASGDTELSGVTFDPQGITTPGTGQTVDDISTLRLVEPIITVGTGDTVTLASTLYIANAPTEGATNAALYVNSGDVIVNSGDLTVSSGFASLGTFETNTISSGAITPTKGMINAAAEAGTADDLATITTTNMPDGAFGWIKADTGDTITIKDGTGNIAATTGADIVLDSDELAFYYRDGSTIRVGVMF